MAEIFLNVVEDAHAREILASVGRISWSVILEEDAPVPEMNASVVRLSF